TFTTLAAFFPLLFWTGIMGEFMSYLPLTLVITLFSSLVVALVINPALTSIFVKARRLVKGKRLTAEEIAESGEKPAPVRGVFLKLYVNFLRGALKHRMAVMCISFLTLILLFQVWFMGVGVRTPVEFFPDMDPNSAYINLKPPEGADLDYIDRIIRRLEMLTSGAVN
ncbi:MAG: efflux RND transporter permease subunit, partial [Desulfobacterales bacterium]|nr:efflux RND transporter permease subunit [Desulfobacterales bacterium]